VWQTTCSRWFLDRGFSTLKMEAIRPPKRRFTQDLHGATYQQTAFFCGLIQPCNASYCHALLHLSENPADWALFTLIFFLYTGFIQKKIILTI
jgi:hypothetical protein